MEQGYHNFNETDLLDISDSNIYQREEDWKNGFHYTKEGREFRISEITIPHLLNIIKCFKNTHNVLPLEIELRKRKKQHD